MPSSGLNVNTSLYVMSQDIGAHQVIAAAGDGSVTVVR
jgi:hypothetical protein